MTIQLGSQLLAPATTSRDVGQFSSNRRQFARRPVQKHGLIRMGNLPAVSCLVVDVSPGGAKLKVDPAHLVPQVFKLQIPYDLFEAECEVRYESGSIVGVMFTSNRMEALAHYS